MFAYEILMVSKFFTLALDVDSKISKSTSLHNSNTEISLCQTKKSPLVER